MIRIARVPADADASGEIGAFVGAHPAATAYAMPAWLAAMRRFMGVETRYHTATLDGRLVGVLPVAERPLHPWAAPLPAALRPTRHDSLGHDCYAGPLVAVGLGDADAARILAALVQSLDGPGALLRTLFPPAWAELDELRGRLVTEHGYRAVRGYPIGVKPLAGLTAATLPGTYHQSHKRAVEAARKRGVVVSAARDVGDYLEFCDLLDETMEHAGASSGFSKDFIVEGGRALVRAGLGELLLARVDGEPVAGVFVLGAARSSCYWLGASAKDEKAQKHRPMNAVFHRAFTDAIDQGRAWFELGGLVTEGLRTFKTRWGVRELEQHTYEWSYRDLAEPLRAARGRLAGRLAARLRPVTP